MNLDMDSGMVRLEGMFCDAISDMDFDKTVCLVWVVAMKSKHLKTQNHQRLLVDGAAMGCGSLGNMVLDVLQLRCRFQYTFHHISNAVNQTCYTQCTCLDTHFNTHDDF